MKFRQARKRSLWGRKVNTVYKTWRGTSFELKKLRKPKFRLEAPDACCSDWIGNKVSIFISIIRHHLCYSYRNVSSQRLIVFLFYVENESKKQRYLVMGKRISTSNGKNVKLVPTFIHPWVRSKVSFKNFLGLYLSIEISLIQRIIKLLIYFHS